MAADYRITIRTDQETADAFRELADDVDLTLGELLESFVIRGMRKTDNEALCANLLALKYAP